MKPLHRSLIAAVLLCAACSRSNTSKPSDEIEAFPKAFESSQASQSNSENPNNPVSVNVAQAFVDSDKNLHVKVHVEAKTDVDPRTLKLIFRGLKEGDVVRQEERMLSADSDRETIAAGDTVVSRFIVSAEDLTEYQVECAWGVEPLEALAQNGSDESVEPVEADNAVSKAVEVGEVPESERGAIRVLEVDSQPISCRQEPCGVRLVVTAVLKNGGADRIDGARVAVGLVWRAEGEPIPPLPTGTEPLPGEDVIVLSNLGIDTGAERKMRLRIAEEVPVVPGGQFEPTIRLLSIDTSER
ncbi:MAG: hypothetical protein KDD66_00065 [Bdellovibrionales bacterium]|nr:hypothetical protein [Bdellovibrionales bacterium]